MNKTEFIAAVAKAAGASKVAVATILATEIEVIEKTLKKGDSVQLIGFGTFGVAKRAARTGRNPATGKAIKIAASKTPKFKAGNALKKAVK